MRIGRRRALELGLALFFIVIIAALTGAAEAADQDIFGDWVVTGGVTHINDRTIDVRGNVTIRDGATLKLENCTLAINASTIGQYGLEVTSGGRLEAYDSLIYGNNARISVAFRDDTVLQGSTIKHIHGGTSNRGVHASGGVFTAKDSVIEDSNYYGVYAQTDTLLDNVTMRDVTYSFVYVYNWGMASPVTITISNSRFLGDGSAGTWKGGVYVWTYTAGEQVDLVVRNTEFNKLARGFYASASGKLDATVDGCTFTDCTSGITLATQNSGGTYTFKNNVITAPGLTDATGIALALNTGTGLTLTDNVVKDLHTGYTVSGPWTGSYTGSIGNISVTNVTRGIVTDRNLALTIHNSSFTLIKSSWETFVAGGGSTITVVDTEHAKGSGSVTDGSSWIRAYTRIELLGAKWKDGDAIPEGFLILENITQVEVSRFNLSRLETKNVIGWEVDSNTRRTSEYLYPALYVQGHGFRGERFNIWSTSTQRVELVDDFVPSIIVGTPAEGGGFSTPTISATGFYSELGSGIMYLERSLDGGAWAQFYSFYDGNWNLPLVDLSDGEHVLSLRPRDKVGNLGDFESVAFVIDTTIPHIDLEPTEALVNVTSLKVSGQTEVEATVTIGSQTPQVDEDGGFSLSVLLDEGANVITIEVVDRAGNTNSTTLRVVRDTVVPSLVVTAPEGDIWTNVRFVYVEGLAEEGVDLRVRGDSVPILNGSFRKRVDLEAMEEFEIRVTAADKAGNTAVKTVVLHVDWTPPGLEIVEPVGGEAILKGSTLYISGDVDDPTIDHVIINEQVVDLTSGRFVKQFTVLEGTTIYNITATDAAGNTASTIVVAIRDLTAPTYTVELFAQGGELVYKGTHLYSTAPVVIVDIVLNEASNVTLGDGTVLPAGTEFNLRYDMVEGINDIELIITDRGGNNAPDYRERIIVDTTAPEITLYQPNPGDRTKEDTVIVHGVTEVGSTVSIDGESVTLLTGGEFRHVIALFDGRNDFTIAVEDAMGNTNSATFSVLKDPDVKDEPTSTTGATMGGMLVGMIIGAALSAAFFVVQGRKKVAEAEAERTWRVTEGSSPDVPATSDAEEDFEEVSGWEEY